MNKYSFFSLIVLFIFSLAVGLAVFNYFFPFKEAKKPVEIEKAETGPEGIMFLIEYMDTPGLENFVVEMEERGIHGLLMVTPEFVQEHCDEIKNIIKHNVEIVGCNVDFPFWDVPYEEQKARIVQMKSDIELCTETPVRIISSRYFASDANTIKIAEELGIPYVTARGTTDTKATVYQPEGYNVKILSVSNIPKVHFKYGSMCDYSYFERAGTPDEMFAELKRAVQPLTPKEKARYGSHHKITPVTHTNIGGYLKPWMEMWQRFWDGTKVQWLTLDEFMAEPDWILPLWQIPINKNAPYTAEKIRPLVPWDEEQKVENPCAVPGNSNESASNNSNHQQQNQDAKTGKIIVFHNNRGPMCIEMLKWLEQKNYIVEQHLTGEDDFLEKLNNMKSSFNKSEGVSGSFGYYPIIFVGDKAFSGFNDEIKEKIIAEIGE